MNRNLFAVTLGLVLVALIFSALPIQAKAATAPATPLATLLECFRVNCPGVSQHPPGREIVKVEEAVEGLTYKLSFGPNWEGGGNLIEVTVTSTTNGYEAMITDLGADGKVDFHSFPSNSYEGKLSQQIYDRALRLVATAISKKEVAQNMGERLASSRAALPST